jgi:hypothetical protein
MLRERQNKRFRAAITICTVLGLIEAALLMGVGGYFKGGMIALAVAILFWVLLGVLLGMVQWFFPYAIVVLGLTKIREQRREAIEALGIQNVVNSDPEGERKLHDYLTAITSTEARIGLLQRSDPYIPPEQRPPEGASRPRLKFSKPTWVGVWAYVIAGAVGGTFMVRGELPETIATPVKYVMASAIGATFGLLVGTMYALVFGRTIEVAVEEPNDAGRSGSETA